jgi:hypothetical protein
METLFDTFSYILFLLIGVYLGSTEEKKAALKKAAQKVIPQKKRKPITRTDRELKKKLDNAPQVLHDEIVAEHTKKHGSK